MNGGGGDIWGTSDGFHFYYQQLVGNGTVIARLTNMPSGTGISAWAKAGVMMRNDLTPGSPNAFVSLDGTNGQRFSYRTKENGTSIGLEFQHHLSLLVQSESDGNPFTLQFPDGVTSRYQLSLAP